MKKPADQKNGDLPNIGAPATRALAEEGIQHLRQLTKYSEKQLLALHGVGPRAIRILQSALTEMGLSFKK